MCGTGITTFLENDGQLEQAQYMAGHANVRTTRLDDRRQQNVTQDEVERLHLFLPQDQLIIQLLATIFVSPKLISTRVRIRAYEIPLVIRSL